MKKKMTWEEILNNAIKKAVKNGWNDFDGKGSYLDKDISGIIIGMWHIEKIIFSHPFANAFWGDYPIDVTTDKPITGKTIIKNQCDERWQYHLQQMVLEREPLKYLERFL